MPETQPPFIDTTTVTTAGTPVVLTTRDIICLSVYLVAAEANSGANVYIVDRADTTKKVRLPGSGLSIPVNTPSEIMVDADTSGDIVEWVAL